MDLFKKYVLDCKCTKEFLATPLWNKVLVVIGALVVFSLTLRLLRFVWKNFLAGGKVGSNFPLCIFNYDLTPCLYRISDPLVQARVRTQVIS